MTPDYSIVKGLACQTKLEHERTPFAKAVVMYLHVRHSLDTENVNAQSHEGQ